MLKEILEHIQYVLNLFFNPEKEYNINIEDNFLTKKDYTMYQLPTVKTRGFAGKG